MLHYTNAVSVEDLEQSKILTPELLMDLLATIVELEASVTAYGRKQSRSQETLRIRPNVIPTSMRFVEKVTFTTIQKDNL